MTAMLPTDEEALKDVSLNVSLNCCIIELVHGCHHTFYLLNGIQKNFLCKLLVKLFNIKNEVIKHKGYLKNVDKDLRFNSNLICYFHLYYEHIALQL